MAGLRGVSLLTTTQRELASVIDNGSLAFAEEVVKLVTEGSNRQATTVNPVAVSLDFLFAFTISKV